ncbi:MAG: ATP-binding cassette domain-containing protein [Bacteroidales bacterium]|jgi:cell division transport system ATP-binding protein|nr:ATP-binding cassette domain-containing protein [Bacteroidales bacterium]
MANENACVLIKAKSLDVYQQDECVLSQVDLNIGIGEFVYLIGKIGSGKSSLLKTFYAELPIRGGEVEVVDYSLKKIKRKKIPFLRRKIGMVFQDIELLNDRTVFENLKFVLKATGWKKTRDIKKRIFEVLDMVGMTEKINSFPKQLSGGEKQCVNIARALLNNPLLIFADEPTSNLDPESANTVISLLYELSKTGISVILVTHNYLLTKKFKGKIYLCKNKRILQLDDVDINEIN